MATNCAPEGSLPFGWQTRVSKRHPDRIYYFNTITGSSTWECPELDFSKKNQQEKQENLQSDIKGSKRKRESSPINTLSLLKQASDKLVTVSENAKQKVPSSQNLGEGCSSKPHAPPTAIVTPVVQNLINKGKLNKPNVSLPNTKAAEVSRPKARKNKLQTRQEVTRSTPEVSSNSQPEKTEKCGIKRKRTDTADLAKGIEHNEAVASTSKAKDDDKDTEDIEMFDVSMDCIDDLTSKSDTVFDTLAKYYIVVDTNVLISKLNLIDELKDTPLDGCGPPHIFIPWIVIEELDRLKSSRNWTGQTSKSTMRAACEAVRYLNSVLSKHPRFHGQSPAEAEAWAKSYSKVNDDKILECCMALGDKMSKEKVILLTNDKNLVNKALICGINVHDWVSMMEKVKPDVKLIGKRNRKRNSADKESQSVAVPGDSSKATDNSSKEHVVWRSKHDICKREIHTLMSTARQLLKDVLTPFVKQEMFEAYGEVWLSFPVELKLLKGILDVIQKYWKMVFSEIFNGKDKRNFELLFEKVSRPEGFLGDKEECLIILSAVEDIFRQIKRRNPKNKDIPIEKIQDLRVVCVDTFTRFSEIESTIRDAEFKDVHAVFEQNWGIMNQLCGLVMDFSSVPHDFQYEKPEQLPSEMDFRLLMCNFYPALQQIKVSMTNMVDLVSKNKPSRQTFKKLANSLLQFIPSLKIPCEMVPHSHFSQKALERFCTHPQNREMIEIGCKQIEKFYTKLDEALSALMKSNFSGSASPENMLLD